MNEIYFAWISGFVILAILSFTLKQHRTMVVNVLIVYATVFAGIHLYDTILKRASGNQPYTKADKAELMLKLSSGWVALESYIPKSKQTKQTSKELLKKFYVEADKNLEDAVELAPKSTILRTKRIIVDGEQGRNVRKQIAELKKIDSDKGRDFSKLLEAIYIKRKISKSEFKEMERIATQVVPAGWFREIANLEVYKNAKKRSYRSLHSEFLEHYLWYVVRIFVFLGCVTFLGFVGIIVILVQLFFMPRSPTSEHQRALIAAPDGWTWKAVYGVFVGWLATEFVVGPPLREVSRNLANIATEQGSIAVALLTAGLYLIQNLPALFFIWLFALRQAKVPILDALKIRFKVEKFPQIIDDKSGKPQVERGPFKMIFAGVLTWLAAIPIIVCALYISSKIGSQGSDNPIVAVVLSAAKDANILGIVLFIFTLGVLPGLCEEVLFRGFLYTSLRKRLGAFTSMVLSAILFSAAHLDFGGALQLFCLGFLFAYIFERTKSLIPSMVAHCLWNSGTFMMAIMLFA